MHAQQEKIGTRAGVLVLGTRIQEQLEYQFWCTRTLNLLYSASTRTREPKYSVHAKKIGRVQSSTLLQ